MNRTPIPKKRKTLRAIHSERTGSHKRERLYGAAKAKRRAEIFERAGGRCEELIEVRTMFPTHDCISYFRCRNRATEWSHIKHGPRKCDCMACGIASCTECHKRRHNGGNGKPCPAKPKMEAK